MSLRLYETLDELRTMYVPGADLTQLPGLEEAHARYVGYEMFAHFMGCVDGGIPSELTDLSGIPCQSFDKYGAELVGYFAQERRLAIAESKHSRVGKVVRWFAGKSRQHDFTAYAELAACRTIVAVEALDPDCDFGEDDMDIPLAQAARQVTTQLLVEERKLYIPTDYLDETPGSGSRQQGQTDLI